jgi:hypothetical protein
MQRQYGTSEKARGEVGDRRPSGQTRSGKKQEDIGHVQAKTGANGFAHILIKHPNSRWFHEPAVGFMGIVRLIYLFIYLFIHTPVTIYISVSIRPGHINDHTFPFSVYENAWIYISSPCVFVSFAEGNVIFAHPQIGDC